jgi:hypothetical protein
MTEEAAEKGLFESGIQGRPLQGLKPAVDRSALSLPGQGVEL